MTPYNISTSDSIGGDHLPVIIDYERQLQLQEVRRREKWKFNFDPEKDITYRENIAQYEIPDKNLEEQIEDLTHHIIHCGKGTFKFSRGKLCRQIPRLFWNEECSNAVAKKRQAFNKWRRNPNREFMLAYRRLEAKATKVIKKCKKKSFREWMSKQTFRTKASHLWRVITNIEGRFSNEFIYPLTENGQTLIGDMAKAELMAQYYHTLLGNIIPLANENFIRESIDEGINDLKYLELNKDFEMTDLNNEITLLKTKKAIGNDSIANELLKKSPEDFREKLLETFNTCWM